MKFVMESEGDPVWKQETLRDIREVHKTQVQTC